VIRKLWLALALVALVAFLALAAACGDDDDDDGGGDDGDATADPALAAEVEEVATQVLTTDPTDEAAVDFFLGHVTEGFVGYLGYDTAEDCAANAEDCIGEPTGVASLEETAVDGDAATTIATSTEGDVISLSLVRENDLWKIDGFAFSAEVPEGATVVEVSGIDYGYEWDPGDAAGATVFAFTNDGEEAHEMAITSVGEDFDIEAVKEFAQSEESGQTDPPGVTGYPGFGFATPGLTSHAVLEEPLPPGNYVLLCFIPDAEGTPHVVSGMFSEFTVE
jgi:hypothetical protein